jgi:hypothetical protein
MGTAQVAFAEVLWGATGNHMTGSDVTGSDVSHVTGNDISHVQCPEVCSGHAQPEVAHIRPSRVFWPEVTSVTWLEEALSGSRFCACSTGSCTISTLAGPFDRKWPCPEAVMTGSRFCACPAFFLVVVPWLPKVTWVCACATGSCATPVMTEGHVTPSEVSLGCSLRTPRPIFSMVIGTSPGYLPLLFSYNVYIGCVVLQGCPFIFI